MKIKTLYELYHSKKNHCCKCGCALEDVNGELGSVFVLDKKGNFYCSNCDKDFREGDERIFEAEFYPKTKVDLYTDGDVHNIMYVYADKYDIEEAIEEVREYINIWQNNDYDTSAEGIPENFKDCERDEDFYVEMLWSRFEVEYPTFDDELSVYY